MLRCTPCLADKPEPDVLAKCDACYTFPCQNGASCRPVPLRDYECDCPPGFHGRNCQHPVDACYGSPCENHGTCKVLEEGRFRWGRRTISMSCKRSLQGGVVKRTGERERGRVLRKGHEGYGFSEI